MAKREFTNIYVSVRKEDDDFIDNYRMNLIKEQKKHFTKSETAQIIMRLGMDVIEGKYLYLDPEIDKFVSQLQDMVIVVNGEKVIIRKTKEQVYNMLIEKGIKHLGD